MDRLTWRAKIGLIVVSSAIVSELRYPRAAPPGVCFLTTRMRITGGLEAMERDAKQAVEDLASAKVDVIAYCCTVSGAHRGLEGDRAFCRQVEQRWSISATSTMLAVVEALGHLGVTSVVVTSPYREQAHEAERAYLERAGIHPLVMRGMGLESVHAYAAVSPEDIYRFSLDAWDDRAGGLFISCMNLDGMAAAQALEERIGKPVVTSHSATLWRALALAGIDDPIQGYGKLLAGPRCPRVNPLEGRQV